MHHASSDFRVDRAAYFNRIGVLSKLDPTDVPANLETLTLLQDAQIRSIAFENADVVLRQTISISPADIEQKLVKSSRGGYCFEQNVLLMCVLNDLGYAANPILCRVRYNKPAGSKTPFTHVALRVKLPNNPTFDYLVDVGFAGNGSTAPLLIHSEEAQDDAPFGQSRILRQSHEPSYRLVQWKDTRGEWIDMYEFPEGASPEWVDLEMSNWWSCTMPSARFVSSFFAYRLIGVEKHHILNETYVIRHADGSSEKREITAEAELRALLVEVFGLEVPLTEGLGRYLRLVE